MKPEIEVKRQVYIMYAYVQYIFENLSSFQCEKNAFFVVAVIVVFNKNASVSFFPEYLGRRVYCYVYKPELNHISTSGYLSGMRSLIVLEVSSP